MVYLKKTSFHKKMLHTPDILVIKVRSFFIILGVRSRFFLDFPVQPMRGRLKGHRTKRESDLALHLNLDQIIQCGGGGTLNPSTLGTDECRWAKHHPSLFLSLYLIDLKFAAQRISKCPRRLLGDRIVRAESPTTT